MSERDGSHDESGARPGGGLTKLRIAAELDGTGQTQSRFLSLVNVNNTSDLLAARS